MYQLWQNWSEINKPNILVCITKSKHFAEEIKIALEKLKGLHNYYIKEKKIMNDGDLIVEYKKPESIDRVLDDKIRDFLKTLGYKWVGSGILLEDNIRDIQFRKIKK